LTAGSFWVGQFLFPTELAVLFSLISTTWLTRAFAEEGFAQVADGFTQENNQLNAQLTNRCLGAQGVVGLGLLLAVKFMTLQTIFTVRVFNWDMVLQVMTVHSLSRFIAITIPSALPNTDDSNQQPLSTGALATNFLLALLPLIGLVLYSGLWIYLTFLIPLAFVRWSMIRLFRSQNGRYHPACYGATQQVAEAVLYLSFVSLLWISV